MTWDALFAFPGWFEPPGNTTFSLASADSNRQSGQIYSSTRAKVEPEARRGLFYCNWWADESILSECDSSRDKIVTSLTSSDSVRSGERSGRSATIPARPGKTCNPWLFIDFCVPKDYFWCFRPPVLIVSDTTGVSAALRPAFSSTAVKRPLVYESFFDSQRWERVV